MDHATKTEIALGQKIAPPMLDWYDQHRRHLPWRHDPGIKANPYYVWMSEIMLQQTTVATVKSYFEKFTNLWPDISDMANAPLEDILQEWAGLGYYARARNLHKCAQTIMQDFNGQFPETEAELLMLPGIGPYTAAAIASIAFNQRAVVVDGNIERVMSRVFKSYAELPKERAEFYRLANLATPDSRVGDYAQSLMDLGATICTPKSPKCAICPIQPHCLGKLEAEGLPRKAPKKIKPTRKGLSLWITTLDGYLLLERRPEKGLLGKMPGLPGTDWIEGQEPDIDTLMQKMQFLPKLEHQLAEGEAKHTFTHFHLFLSVGKITLSNTCDLPHNYFWLSLDQLDEFGLPTVFKKAVSLAQR
ncbi:A/G-specific adenine glycosylase [Curvivirga aplysinae]|uniref:A/G-specific adenine glycosylase n=1 Tax=Curvivirga aplysinae TaxID=2529852 RepID=UPI0012BC83FF|nr:A/G-specific adenine glycosylase [Curvivirga aplysinae]MTI08875.1 A/G-specific adenine glycosylase [Curvivirga aplysinae]